MRKQLEDKLKPEKTKPMTEEELVNAFDKQHELLSDLNQKLNTCKTEAKKNFLREEIENIKAEIEETKHQLVEIEDKSYSNEFRATLVKEIIIFATAIAGIISGKIPIQPQKATPGSTSLTPSVKEEKYRPLITDPSIYIPEDLLSTYTISNRAEADEIVKFFYDEALTLSHMENPNYLMLLEYCVRLQNKMQTLNFNKN